MIVISNHVNQIGMEFPEKAVIRINTAWISSIEELKSLLDELSSQERVIWVDYPTGRTKPPVPQIPMKDVIECVNQYARVKYFALSNCESFSDVLTLQSVLANHIEIIPKIETTKGVDNLQELFDSSHVRIIMLDKEDLYVSVKNNPDDFNLYVERARTACSDNRVVCLELKGVIFAPYVRKVTNG